MEEPKLEELPQLDIATMLTLPVGERVNIRTMIADKKVLPKNNGQGNYMILSIQDLTGKFDFPVWDDIELLDASFEVGMVIDIANASIGTYQGTTQLKFPRFHILSGEELAAVDMSKMVPSYDVPKELIDRFEFIMADMKEPYKSIALQATGALGRNPERWKAFLECVAAEKHHGNKRGGLFLHTYGVLCNVEKMIETYVTNPFFYDAKDTIVPDRIRLKAILHDLEKLKEYEYQTCIRRKPGRIKGHVYDGIIYIQKINDECGGILTEEEVDDLQMSILTHHGQWGPMNPETPEEWMLHLADMIDSKIVGYLEK